MTFLLQQLTWHLQAPQKPAVRGDLQLSPNLNFPCPVVKAYDVFSKRVLSSSYEMQPTGMAIVQWLVSLKGLPVQQLMEREFTLVFGVSSNNFMDPGCDFFFYCSIRFLKSLTYSRVITISHTF